jgi:hypothetical protein
MKGTPDKIYIATRESDYSNPKELEFNIILENPPTGGIIYREYIAVSVVKDLLEKLRVVCGKRAMRFVDKQIKQINEYKDYIEI